MQKIGLEVLALKRNKQVNVRMPDEIDKAIDDLYKKAPYMTKSTLILKLLVEALNLEINKQS